MHLLITGASGALGQVVVQHALEAGHTVTACVRRPLPMTHSALRCEEVDLTNETDTQELIQRLPAIDACFLLAGGFAIGNLIEITSAQLLAQLQLNFFTAYNIARPVLQHMIAHPKDSPRHIVCVGARPALHPEQGLFAAGYTLSKALMLPLVQLLNAQGQEHQIRSSLLVPSIIDTPQNRAAMPTADPTQWVTPLHIAQALLLLVDNQTIAWRDTILKVYHNA